MSVVFLKIANWQSLVLSTVNVTMDQNVTDEAKYLDEKISKRQTVIATSNVNMQNSYEAPPQHTFKAGCDTEYTPSYLKLLTNQLFWARIVIFLVTIFLFLLSLSYTFGQILSVEISNFWCPSVTLSQIKTHSIAINSNGGVGGSCWSTKQNTVNHYPFCYSLMFEYNKYMYSASHLHIIIVSLV